MRVTLKQFATLKAIKNGMVISHRIPQTGKFRHIGTTGNVLGVLLERNWVEEIQISQDTITYVPTLKGLQALIRLEQIKIKNGVRIYEE